MLRGFAGGRLFGARTGTGAPGVLALHGWARTHRDFDAVLSPPGRPALDAVAVDLPGFGATPPPDEAWGSADYARCVVAVVEEMAAPVVVLGHSFGGRVAVELAAGRPDLVRALVLTGVPLLRARPPGRPSPRFRLARALHRAGVLGDERMEAARRRYGSADYAAARGIMREVLVRSVGETYEAALDAVACPVSLVWGDDDPTVPLAVAEAAAARLARAELTVCPGAGHLVPLTAPERLRAAVERSLG
ncbi:MAG: alpha/beta fold hydrolase [Acidimicrobiales bacterium]